MPSGAAPAGRARRLAALGFAGLALAGLAGGAAAHTLTHAPPCPPDSSISLCVPPSVGHEASTASRLVRRMVYHDEARADLASPSNRVFRTDGSPPAPLHEDLRLATWNLHRGQGRQEEGSREQVPQMVRELRRAEADVYLLQEVPPWRVSEIVNGVGMDGYYTNTAPGQGNLVLVHPDLEVLGNHRTTLTFEVEDATDAARVVELWKSEGPAFHPRSAQALRLGLPDGSRVVAWNAHLTNVDYTEGQRLAEAGRLADFLDAVARPGDRVVGGGDLNAREGSPEVTLMEGRGHPLEGPRIDLLSGPSEVESRVVADGWWQVSDHPLVTGSLA